MFITCVISAKYKFVVESRNYGPGEQERQHLREKMIQINVTQFEPARETQTVRRRLFYSINSLLGSSKLI